MSRSYKKPIFKESGRGSNKGRKTLANQRLRGHLKSELRRLDDPEDYDDDYQGEKGKRHRLFTDPWDISDYAFSEYWDTKRSHDRWSESEYREYWDKTKRK